MSNVGFCKRYVHVILALGVLGGFATVAAQGQPQAAYQPGRHDAITDVPGVTVGADVVVRAVIKCTEAATSIPGWLCYTEWRSEKARQERTIDDLRKLGHAWMAWQFDMMSAANPPKLPPHPTAKDLEAVLTPEYIQEIPAVDGWQNKLELTLSSQRTSVGVNSISIRSPGADGVFEEFPQEPKAFLPTDYDHDLVWQDGYLLTWPEGTRR